MLIKKRTRAMTALSLIIMLVGALPVTAMAEYAPYNTLTHEHLVMQDQLADAIEESTYYTAGFMGFSRQPFNTNWRGPGFGRFIRRFRVVQRPDFTLPPTWPTPDVTLPPAEPTPVVTLPVEPTPVVTPPAEPTPVVTPPTEPTPVVTPPTEPTPGVTPPTEPTPGVTLPPAAPIPPHTQNANAIALMERINRFSANSIIIHNASSHTNASLSSALAANPDMHHMVEGRYVILHFPQDIWTQINNPLDKMDSVDFLYSAQLELLGRNTPFMPDKLVFLTNYRTTFFMYMGFDHCGFSLDAARHSMLEWNEIGFPGWGIGHEIGHYMEILGAGMRHDAHSGESWVNIFNVYSFYRLGRYDWAREFLAGVVRDYSGANGRYQRFQGRNFETLNDNERRSSVLEANTWLFAQLPMLLIENYGWDGIQRFFVALAENHNNGATASRNIQDRIDYKVVTLSNAYGMDLSALFDHWTLSPSSTARRSISHLPPERIITRSLGIVVP